MTAQHDANRRCLDVPHAGIGDDADIGLRVLRLWAARNPSSEGLPDSSSPSRKTVTATGRVPCTACQARKASKKVISLALVVDRAARHDPLAALGPRRSVGSKGGEVPELERFRGLHVVMSVIKEPAARHRRGRDDGRPRPAGPASRANPPRIRWIGRLAQPAIRRRARVSRAEKAGSVPMLGNAAGFPSAARRPRSK